jgi:hypothetical protein
MTDEEYLEIEEEARKRFIKFQRSYMCQDINLRHDFSYWIALVTKEKFGVS